MAHMQPIDTTDYTHTLLWFLQLSMSGHPTKATFEEAWCPPPPAGIGEAHAKAAYAHLQQQHLIEPGSGGSIQLSAKGRDECEHLRRGGQPRYL